MDPTDHQNGRTPPSTRYRGSKAKLLSWIWTHLQSLDFHSALDGFGGTASVSYLLKSHGKEITYNDNLKFNYHVGHALIANSRVRLTDEDVKFLLKRHRGITYDDFITRTFRGVYFTKQENEWLDMVIQNIQHLPGPYKRSVAYFALFQACLIKRPYNLFHRKNLYMRLANVERSFGNKTTWDTSFEQHFKRFVSEINEAIFNSGVTCQATNYDALEVPNDYDLVYLDAPYISKKGQMDDYLWLYHFLEGIVDYDNWSDHIDFSQKHRPFQKERPTWSDEKHILNYFRDILDHYRNSTLVLAYRNDGLPREEELVKLMKQFKKKVKVVHYGEYQYALSSNGHSRELMIIGR